MNRFFHHYINEHGEVIRVFSRFKKKPIKDMVYVLHEFSEGKFQMPCFPEIPGGQLAKMTYLGCVNPDAKEDV